MNYHNKFSHCRNMIDVKKMIINLLLTNYFIKWNHDYSFDDL